METTGGSGQRQNSNQADYQTFFSFFGLRENPFRANPDPRYLFRSSGIRRAQNELVLGLQSGKSLIVLTGEAGTGKTSLVNYLLASLRQQQIPVAFIFNSHLDISNLFEFILSDFGIKYDAKLHPNLRILLNQWLVEHYQSGKVPVIILDEAQGLSAAVLEEVRMLLNLQAAGENLVRIVLAGQPELDTKLNRPELRQLRQRIMVRCRTAPLSGEEAHGYIQQRLRVGGSPDGAAFSAEAMDAVHFYSAGVPRVMNLICEHSLINAYSDGVRPVPPGIVEDVAREFRFDEYRPLPSRSSLRPGAEIIPMDAGVSRMRMSALAAREWAPIAEPPVDVHLVAELLAQAAPPEMPALFDTPVSPQIPIAAQAATPAEKAIPAERQIPPIPPIPSTPPIPPEPMRHFVAAAAASSSLPKVAAKPGVSVPARATSAPADRKPATYPVRSIPKLSAISRSRAVAKPVALRFRATSAKVEASVTRMIHKLDELKAMEKLQRLAGNSLQWLRQPMRPTHLPRVLTERRQKS